MTTDPKPLTRAELIEMAADATKGLWFDPHYSIARLARTVAALLPAEVLPPIDKDDERTVDALVAAKTGQARRMVTHSCPSCEHHVKERDAAIARAEKAESELAKAQRPGLCPHTDADGMPGCRECGIESGYVTRSTYLDAIARARGEHER